MGHFVTGVTVVTALDGDRPFGITVNALSSVSLDPPLVMVALDRRRFLTPIVRAAGRYRGQHPVRGPAGPLRLLRRAPRWNPAARRSAARPGTSGETGLPLIDGAIATLECTVVETFSAGDHDLFIGRVDALANEEHHPMPLLYYRRRYLRIERAATAEVEGKPERRPGPSRTRPGPPVVASAAMPTIRANDLDDRPTRWLGPERARPLVMLHGATTLVGRATLDLAAQIDPVPSPMVVHAVPAGRRRGHATPRDATRWDVADGFEAEWLVDDLEAFVDALGLLTFHLAGYSMGAMTALGFATRAPERLRTLVVVGITTAREPRASVARRLMDPERILRDDPAWAAEMARTIDPAQGPGAWRRLLPAIAADVATQPLLTPAELRAIAAPTLVACGDRDPLVPVGQAWELSRQVRDGRLFVAPDSGHDVLTRRPALANEALLGFYRSTESVADPAIDSSRSRTGGVPMTTLLALYRRPDGGPEAQATFERRYAGSISRSSRGRPASARRGSAGSPARSAARPT